MLSFQNIRASVIFDSDEILINSSSMESIVSVSTGYYQHQKKMKFYALLAKNLVVYFIFIINY